MQSKETHSRRRFLKLTGVSALAASVSSLLAETGGIDVRSGTGRAPVLFIGHGSPMNAIERNIFTEGWIKTGQHLNDVRAILSISAHWETTRGSLITASQRPKLIYDMHGFPQGLYRVNYPAEGSPQLASGVARLRTGYTLATSNDWGLDHGTWSVLVHLRPQADIPVVQLSLNRDLGLEDHLALGGELAALRDMGVAIMGSGNIVHNLRLRRMDGVAYDWAHEFDARVSALIDDRNFWGATDLGSIGTAARLAHPSLEHYLPLMYALGAIDDGDDIHWFNQGFTKASLGMRSLISL